ncbi:MAG: hypothetical protein WKF73_15620 [Nocardioidaceae bacterium]
MGPSSEHLLGADLSGRDTLSRLIYGARLGLLGPLCVVACSTLLGLLFGLVAALARWLGRLLYCPVPRSSCSRFPDCC